MTNNTRNRHESTRLGRGRSSLLCLVAGAVLAVPVSPATAHHFEPPGTNGAQLFLSSDSFITPVSAPSVEVAGKSFTPNALVHVFECAAGATESDKVLREECQPLTAARTDADGAFTVEIDAVLGQYSPDFLQPAFVAPNGTTTICRTVGATQCAVAAATFSDATFSEVTSQAEHWICFRPHPPFDQDEPCSQRPEGPTTTTTPPPPEPQWEPAASMNVARQRLATAVGNDGRIYALGGTENEDGGEALTTAEVFDPCGNKTWSSLPPMPTARTQLAAATGPDGRIYAIGGRDALWGTPLATVDAYDPATNAWSSVARLAVPRSDLAAATGSDGRIYAIGGTAGGTQAPLVEAYDTVTNSWTTVTPLSAARSDHGATIGPDGRIYAIGGRALSQAPIPRVESYSPGPRGAPGTWTPTKSSMAPPPEMAVVTGPDGLVYGTGGTRSGNTQSLRGVLVYNTATDTWTASSEAMTTRRAAHGAATGRDGRIYAIGGNDEDFGGAGEVPLSSTESLKVGPNACPPPSPPPADFDGDGDTDISVFRPSTGTWFAKDGATSAWGAQGDIPVPGDYDGDRITDVAIFRPSVGLWAIDHSGGGPDTFVTYGIATDVPVPADYDGDGRTDIAVYRPEYATWWVHQSSDGTDTARTFGLYTDVPVPGDYDGDGSADLGIFRDGTWFVQPASGGAYTATAYGIGGDVPVPGDYDSDRTTDMAIFRPSDGTWALHHSGDGADEVFGFGIPGDVPVPGDYDGDWRWDPAVFRASTGEWFIETGQSASWGAASDVPLPLPAAVRTAYFK